MRRPEFITLIGGATTSPRLSQHVRRGRGRPVVALIY